MEKALGISESFAILLLVEIDSQRETIGINYPENYSNNGGKTTYFSGRDLKKRLGNCLIL